MRPLSLVLALAATTATSAAARSTIPVEELVFCICEENCGKVLVNCTCSRSVEYRAEIREMQATGLSDDEIVEAFIGKYGEAMRVVPRADTGFGKAARALPFVVLGGGLLVIVAVGLLWRRRGDRPEPTADATADAKADEPAASESDRALVDRLMGGDDE